MLFVKNNGIVMIIDLGLDLKKRFVMFFTKKKVWVYANGTIEFCENPTCKNNDVLLCSVGGRFDLRFLFIGFRDRDIDQLRKPITISLLSKFTGIKNGPHPWTWKRIVRF